MAYDTLDGQTYILDINEALDFTDTMETSLLCTNQARAHGVVIEDVPRFFDNISFHSISFPDDVPTGSLDSFIHGVPTELLTDGAKELTQSELSKIYQRHHIYQVYHHGRITLNLWEASSSERCVTEWSRLLHR